MRKEVGVVRKKIDAVNKELKPLGNTVQKKVKFYMDKNEFNNLDLFMCVLSCRLAQNNRGLVALTVCVSRSWRGHH